MTFRPVLIIGALATVLLAGAGYAFSQREGGRHYLTAPVEKGTIASFVKATGTVEPVITVEVSSEVSGRVAEVFVNFNDTVQNGQIIAQVDPGLFQARVSENEALLKVAQATVAQQQAALARAKSAAANAAIALRASEAQIAVAQAKFDQAEKELERKQQLMRSGNVTDRDLVQVQTQRDISAAELRAAGEDRNMKQQAITTSEAELRMAEANLQNAQAVVEQRDATLQQARLDLDRTAIRAPLDGTIIKRDVNPGQTVAVTLEAKTLFKIAQDLRRMEVRGKIDEADVGRIQVGQQVQFTVDAFPDRAFEGRVLQIRKAAETVQNVVTYTVIVSADNPDLLLLPGMTATLRVLVSETGPILKIPNQALRFRPNRSETDAALGAQPPQANSGVVWVVGADGRPKPVTVVLGRNRDDSSNEVVLGDLQPGEELIIGSAAPQSRFGVLGLRFGF
jgi:HlyD family secretion protein